MPLFNQEEAKWCSIYNFNSFTPWQHKLSHFYIVYIFFIRGLFDKFEENVYKIVSVYSILLGFAYDTGKYVFDRYCKFLFNMFICKKVTHVLLTYGNKHCRAPNEK